MKLEKNEYEKLYKKRMPKSKFVKDGAMAFIVGGLICAFGEWINSLYHMINGIDDEKAALLTSLTLIFLAALATGLGVYDKLSRHAGAGTLVPITGFANAVVSPALEFKTEGYVLGTGAKMFIIAGPVIVYGTAASVVAGILYYIFR